MHHTDEEIHATLGEIIKRLCSETFPEALTLTSAESKGCNSFPLNINSLQTSQEEDLEVNNRKSEFHSLDLQSDANSELNIKTSTPASQIANEDISGIEQESLDKTIDEAMGKYEFLFEENEKKSRDVYVQTICSGTIDKQCQCDLGPENPHSVSDRSSITKKIKLNDYGFSCTRNGHWKSDTYELQSDEGKKKQYFESATPAPQIKAPRIRVGLSKRVRPAPLHILN